MRRLSYHRLFVLFLLFACRAGLAVETPDFEKTVKPFFREHCFKCHDEQKQKGDLRLDNLPPDFVGTRTSGHWTDILDRINSGDMPPSEEPRPRPQDAVAVVDWIATQLAASESARHASAERISFHKLTRDEYVNTLRDLLGTTYDARDTTGMSEDPDWLGFERIGSVLSLSPSHIEKYLAAARAALDESIALGPQPKQELIRWTPFDMRASEGWGISEKEYKERRLAGKVRNDIVPNNNATGTPGEGQKLKINTSGDYLVRIKVSGIYPKGGLPPRLQLFAADLDRLLFECDVDASEEEPVTLEVRTHLPAGTHIIRIMNAVPGPEPTARSSRGSNAVFTSMKTRRPWQLKLTDEDYQPAWPVLLVDQVEWEGPMFESWPTPAHRRIFGEGNNDEAHARSIVARFAERAFRRPPQPAEVDRYTQFVLEELKGGKTFEGAVRSALLAILCSKNFLYLVEGSPETNTTRLNDYELAARLSYFLWSTLPDDELLAVARAGTLHEPVTLRNQTRRMLADPRAAAFADAFPRQWLQLRRVGMFAPDKTLYPEYDDYLQNSMIAESTSYFRHVLVNNASIREFLDSDWTMLNQRLATHYGIAGVKGKAMRRVALQPEDHRGGLLTQAAVLSLTSDGTRHRPVHRGKWLAESILGRPVPPPPANVPAIKTAAATAPKTSLRERLSAHLEDATCAACHRKIDPMGLAFENYDAIGRWRLEEAVRDGSGANPKIDASGELSDGRRFADAKAFKNLLLDETDKFAAGFTEKLATFAMRRVMGFSDRADLQHIVTQNKADDYRLSSLIETFVTSDLFQKR
jgi:mono/diheme cytochrome c family protein